MEGAPGDLLIRIIQAPHPRFSRRGDQLHIDIFLSLEEVKFHSNFRLFLALQGKFNNLMEDNWK